MKKSKAVLLALLVMLFWGSLYPLAKFGYAQFEISGAGSLLLFAGVRFMICGAAICIYRFFTKKEAYKPVMGNFGGIALAGLFGGTVLTVIGLILGGTMHATSYVAYLTLAAICTASTLGYCIWSKVIEKSDLSETYIINFTQPIFAAIVGMFLLGENIFKWNYLAAFILISAGIFIVQYKKKQKQ